MGFETINVKIIAFEYFSLDVNDLYLNLKIRVL